MRACLLALFLVASTAWADGRICLSRDTLLFGNQPTGTAQTLSSVVSNCGDAPFTLTDVSVHPATAAAFTLATSCTTGRTLAPGQACGIDVTFAPVSPGQVSGALWLYNTTSAGSQLVTFYGRGVDPTSGSTTLGLAPSPLTFDAQVVGTTSPARTLTLRNLGPGNLTLRALVINGPAAYDFGIEGTCGLGETMRAGSSCELYFTFTPAATGVRAAQLNVDAPELANLATMAIRGTGVATPPPPSAPPSIDVIEYLHAPLNHYFLTAFPAEAAALDAGALGPDWQRTGLTFKAYAAGTLGGGAVDVCRFFGTPGVGPSSHFYTGDPAECAAVRTNPHWLDEGMAFRAILPVAGACPASLQPVVRFFRPGSFTAESRHRYARDDAAIAAMRAAAWIEEGPVFCSPP
ncbi:MAG: choice-of-anchor D domain-containing protein [Betaproteobacteria bacterium]